MSKKTAPGMLRFVSLLFFNNLKRDEQKNRTRNFKIPKYAFFNIRKKIGQRNCVMNLKIRKYGF